MAWWIGFSQHGAGSKDGGPFDSEDDAICAASESGLDREDPDYEIWEEVKQDA